MSTGQSAALDPAPRIAYELGAAVAGGDDAEVARLWSSLDGPSRARVVAALGAQARNTARGAGEPIGGRLLAEQFIDVAAELAHCRTQQAALRALGARPEAELPACDGCPLPAVALAGARLRVLKALGFSPEHVAEICRRSARA